MNFFTLHLYYIYSVSLQSAPGTRQYLHFIRPVACVKNIKIPYKVVVYNVIWIRRGPTTKNYTFLYSLSSNNKSIKEGDVANSVANKIRTHL